MSIIANVLKLETFGSFIRRYLIFLYPDQDWIISQLPAEMVIDKWYMITDAKLNTLIFVAVCLGCLIGIPITYLVFGRARSRNTIHTTE